MGTDIHPVVQARVEGRWVDVLPPAHVLDALTARCYPLFAVLANVRNGYGFAGVHTHEPLDPIAEPRGFPPDFEIHAGSYHGAYAGKWWRLGDPLGEYMGENDFSWVSLADLDAYDWAQPLRRGGKAHKSATFDANGRPSEWCGDVWGSTAHEYRTHTWTEPLADVVKGFHDDVLPWLRMLGPPDDVRLVFGFDY